MQNSKMTFETQKIVRVESKLLSRLEKVFQLGVVFYYVFSLVVMNGSVLFEVPVLATANQCSLGKIPTAADRGYCNNVDMNVNWTKPTGTYVEWFNASCRDVEYKDLSYDAKQVRVVTFRQVTKGQPKVSADIEQPSITYGIENVNFGFFAAASTSWGDFSEIPHEVRNKDGSVRKKVQGAKTVFLKLKES